MTDAPQRPTPPPPLGVLQVGDVFLCRSTSKLSVALISVPIRVGEAKALKLDFHDTFYHSALYLGDGMVAEMMASGYAEATVASLYSRHTHVELFRHKFLREDGMAVVAACRKYAAISYGIPQLEVLTLATIYPEHPAKIEGSRAYKRFKLYGFGGRELVCSELVARAFAEAQTADMVSLALATKPWPAMAAVPDSTLDLAVDFVTPTMISLSPTLEHVTFLPEWHIESECNKEWVVRGKGYHSEDMAVTAAKNFAKSEHVPFRVSDDNGVVGHQFYP